MPIYPDQTGKKIEIPSAPKRIISLVPSQTELLFDLELTTEVIGITKFCIHPKEWFRTKTRIGGTKNLKLDKIKALSPDLIIANKEENTKEQVEELAKEFPVWTSDIKNLQQALEMIRLIGKIVNKNYTAEKLANKIQNNFDSLSTKIKNRKRIKACYLIWKDPYMSVGGDSFISDMMNYAGFENVNANLSRYPLVELENLQKDCEMILLSSEPYPFTEKHIHQIKLIAPFAQVALVDGEMFSWYGSRLLKAPEYFLELNEAVSGGSE
jgi:ABC-type Fe3+-hydroxamate transport system substrate-binding protein